MTKEQMIALERDADTLTQKLDALAERILLAPDTSEAAFERRVDAVWGNIATEEPHVKREDVERQLRDSLAAD
jgi:hypothetical protein